MLALVSPPQEMTQTRILRASAMIAAGVADALTTRAVITSGRGYEGNPLMRWAVTSTPKLLAVKVAFNIGYAVFADQVIRRHPEKKKAAWVLAAFVIALQGGVAVWNTQVGR